MSIPVKKKIVFTVGPHELVVTKGDTLKLEHNGMPLIGNSEGVVIPEDGTIDIELTGILGDV